MLLDIINQLAQFKIAGLGLGFLGAILIWGIRIVMAYCRETRDNYIMRLNETVLELEKQKMDNIKLELRIQTLQFMNDLKDRP